MEDEHFGSQDAAEDSGERPSEQRASWASIDDPEAADFLADAGTSRWLEPFLARTLSASDAAAELGVALDAMLYRLRVLRRLGLVEVVGQVPRAGRPIKLYRSTADAFFVPYAVTSYADLRERLLDEGRETRERAAAALARALREDESLGRRIFRREDGKVLRVTGRSGPEDLVLDPVEEARGPVLGDVVFDALRLRDADARAVFERFRALIEFAEARHAESGATYRVGFTFVRDSDADLGG